jgi:hypothetical protein
VIESPDRTIRVGGALLVGALIGAVIHAAARAPGATPVRITHPVVVESSQVSISHHDIHHRGGRVG